MLIIPFSFFLPLPLHSIPKPKSQNLRYDYFIYFMKSVKTRVTVLLSKQAHVSLQSTSLAPWPWLLYHSAYRLPAPPPPLFVFGKVLGDPSAYFNFTVLVAVTKWNLSFKIHPPPTTHTHTDTSSLPYRRVTSQWTHAL